MSDTIELNGLTFRVSVERDDDMGPPWKEHDGHGIISEWTTRDKQPGERVLVTDRIREKRYYDFAETIKIAKRDGWGVENPAGKTKGQIAAEAVEEDFKRMKAWCDDEWEWVYVSVQLLAVDGEEMGLDYRESLSGIESDADKYLDEVARELAEQIAARVGDKNEICVPIRRAS